MQDSVSFIPLGGIGDVTRNMYLYEYQDQILIVDCGLGFPDETMVGVDLLLPDISYLLSTNKKIVGMVLTHGHEDHIGATPFIIPQLPPIPVFASPLTAALTNEKLKEFQIGTRVQPVSFEEPLVQLGAFQVSFIRITHSVPDTANLFIKTPAGNFYHGSDYKFDLTPADDKRTDFLSIAKAGEQGVLCVMSDALGSERPGHTPSEAALSLAFEREIKNCPGKFIVTTYSSNISRLNQAISVAIKVGRRVCFIGRSLVKAKEVGQQLGYLNIPEGMEIPMEKVKSYKDSSIMLLVAGSQGQENSALVRIADGEHRDIRVTSRDVVVFSSDPIPGNEVAVNSLIDTLSKRGIRVAYSGFESKYHVSGHGSQEDILLLMSLVKGKHVLPIGGTYRHMVAFRELAKKLGYNNDTTWLLDDGQELIFNKDGAAQLGRKLNSRNVYVDELSGEEIEHFVLRDRQKLSEGGIVVVIAEVNSSTGQVEGNPEIVARGFSTADNKKIVKRLSRELQRSFNKNRGKITNWIHIRKQIGDMAERLIFKELRRRPLVLPVVIEV